MVLVTREPLPMAVTFTDDTHQLDYECPVTLNVFYRPVSINNRFNFKKNRLFLMNIILFFSFLTQKQNLVSPYLFFQRTQAHLLQALHRDAGPQVKG